VTRANYDRDPLMDAVEQQIDHSGGYHKSRDQWEREYIDALLERHDGNVTAAARAAKLERRTLQRRIKALGIKAGLYR
jgi:DNA-binding NtrC family response regulator